MLGLRGRAASVGGRCRVATRGVVLLVAGVSLGAVGDAAGAVFNQLAGSPPHASNPVATASWTIQPTPNPAGEKQVELNSVSCGSPTTCTSVGDFQGKSKYWSTLVEGWTGSTWSVQSTPVPRGSYESYLHGVSCPSPSACVAVGYYDPSDGGHRQMLGEHWNGAKWTIKRPVRPTGAGDTLLEGVSCSSATACMAVGVYTDRTGKYRTLAERWNGAKWVLELPANPAGTSLVELNAVSCSSSTACTAVGDRGGYTQKTLAERWNGHGWKIERTPAIANSSALRAVSCPSTKTCVAVGDSGYSYYTSVLAEHWNGQRWTVDAAPTIPYPNQAYLNGISCASRRVCTAVGWYTPSDIDPLAIQWANGKWTMQNTPSTGGQFNAVACAAANTCTAVGESNHTLAERYS